MSRDVVRNLGWATLVGVLLGLSPHTSATRVVASVVGGTAGGGLVFTYLELRRRRNGVAASDRPFFPVREILASLPARVWAVLVLAVLLFAPTLGRLYETWTGSIWENGHGLFMPFVIAFLAAWILRREGPGAVESSAWGLPLIVAAVALVVLDTGIQTRMLSALGLVLALPGLSLLLLGARRTRALALPLCLGLLLFPVPPAIGHVLYLPLATAAATEILVDAVGVPLLRVTTILVMADDIFAISDRCSGAAAYVAGQGLAFVLAYYCRSTARRALLLLAPWPLVVFFNALRCAAIVVISALTPIEMIDSAMHGGSGVFAFWSLIGSLLLLADWRRLREAFA